MFAQLAEQAAKAGGSRAAVAFSLGFMAGKRHASRATILARCAAQRPNWQQAMIRVKDPEVSIAFYEKHFGFQLVDKYVFPQWKFGVYFLATTRCVPHAASRPAAEAASRLLPL